MRGTWRKTNSATGTRRGSAWTAWTAAILGLGGSWAAGVRPHLLRRMSCAPAFSRPRVRAHALHRARAHLRMCTRVHTCAIVRGRARTRGRACGRARARPCLWLDACRGLPLVCRRPALVPLCCAAAVLSFCRRSLARFWCCLAGAPRLNPTSSSANVGAADAEMWRKRRHGKCGQ